MYCYTVLALFYCSLVTAYDLVLPGVYRFINYHSRQALSISDSSEASLAVTMYYV